MSGRLSWDFFFAIFWGASSLVILEVPYQNALICSSARNHSKDLIDVNNKREVDVTSGHSVLHKIMPRTTKCFAKMHHRIILPGPFAPRLSGFSLSLLCQAWRCDPTDWANDADPWHILLVVTTTSLVAESKLIAACDASVWCHTVKEVPTTSSNDELQHPLRAGRGKNPALGKSLPCTLFFFR